MDPSYMPTKVPNGKENATVTPNDNKKKSKVIVNPYAKRKSPVLHAPPLPAFVPGAYSAKPIVPYPQLSPQDSNNSDKTPEVLLLGQTTPSVNSNEPNSDEENMGDMFAGLFDAALARQNSTTTRKSRGCLIAKLEIPINQISEELVADLATEVAKKVFQDEHLRREIVMSLLPELAKGMAFTYTQPKPKKRRTM